MGPLLLIARLSALGRDELGRDEFGQQRGLHPGMGGCPQVGPPVTAVKVERAAHPGPGQPGVSGAS
ncbi:hypothetical protein [Streptomyces sp. NPDC059881]|uniref:hypothetical protein n=1 Tax=Streptomyces sp. NPDC059881 TaxID=3346986 RepID=UPI00365BFDEF